MTVTIKSTRKAAGISVKLLAQRMGVTPSAISQLERSEADGTIKVNSLREALAALGADLRLTSGPHGRMSEYAPYRVADNLSRSLLEDGDASYPLRLLTHSIRELENNFDEIDAAELNTAPTPLPDRRWDTLLRAAYANSLPTSNRPAWAVARKLPEPWFVSDYPILRERAKTRTPDYLRDLNIFVDERSLSRA